MLLARRGLDVTMLERADREGGRNGWLKQSGYTFDIGPTFFMMPFVLEEIFEECGRRLSDCVDLRPLEPFYHLTHADGTVFTPSGVPERMREAIGRIHPPDAAGYDRYRPYHEAKTQAILPCLSQPYDRLYHVLKKPLLKAIPHLSLTRTVWEELGLFFADNRVKIGFTFQSKYLGMSPYACPGLFSILAYTEQKWGIFHPIGGCNALSLAMGKLARELGAAIHLNTDVKEIVIENRRARGVLLANGERADFDEIIMNADFAWGMRHLIPNALRRKYTDENLDRKRYSCSTFMMYLGVDRRYDHLAHHNIYISGDYRGNLEDIETRGHLSEDPSFYVQNASVTDASLAPAGHSTIYVLVPVPNGQKSLDWSTVKGPFRERILNKLRTRAGMADIENHIRFERVITPDDWQSDMRVGYGAVFNLGHNVTQMLMFRPHNRFEEFQNMWLVGGGTHPGSGLPTIYESGKITAAGICRKHGIPWKDSGRMP